MKQLSGQDNSFLEIERMGLPQHIASVAIYDQSTAPGGQVRFMQILERLKSRLHLSPLFRSKLQEVPLGLDRPYLIDDADFDLEYHVRHIALPKPGDWRQLLILLARINARPLDLTRPLWEMYVIEGLDNVRDVPPGSFAVLIKLHHSVMDGISAAEMIAAIHDFGPEPREIEPEQARVIRPPYSPPVVFGRAYMNVLRKPRRIYNLARRMMGSARDIKKLPDAERPDSVKREVLTRFNRDIASHRVLGAVTFDFGEVRAVKNSLDGATINDALLAIVSGGLRKYLEAKGELPDKLLTCGCPIDVRDESERGTGGNVIGFMGVDLCVGYKDPLERLKAVHDAAVEAKAHVQASDVRINLDLMEAIPGGILPMAMGVAASMGVQSYNTILSNVPGPPNQLYFAGAQVVEGFGIGPLLPGVGLFHTASSSVMNKQGKINLCFHACREMMPDPDFYQECLAESFAELKAVTIDKGKGKTRAKAKPKAKKKKAVV